MGYEREDTEGNACGEGVAGEDRIHDGHSSDALMRGFPILA
jgi:hypothetical protein